MKESKTYMLATVIVLSVLLILATAPSMGVEKGNESESKCIGCHTHLKNLMRLCWKIEKMRPKQDESAETSGEG
ncbi:MAG: hypothetical protein SWH54_03405 [Thermodesulfobacteriota bacterium]|nr:hypothetical protein [Thermodesulfobacteriota bacterium]